MDTRIRLVPSPKAVHRQLADGSGVILDLDTGEYFGLNATGAAIWRLLDGHHDEAEVVDELRRLVDDPPPDLHRHVRDFVSQLQSRNLVV